MGKKRGDGAGLSLGKKAGLMYILGISCYYHDSAAVILKDGMLLAAAEEERFSRKKHDSSFPKNAINFCLKQAGIKASDLQYVVFYEKPFLKFERLFLNSIALVPRGGAFFRESMREWFFDKLWVKQHISAELRVSPAKIIFSEHHLSHMASAFFCSPYKQAAVLSIDGVGEWTTCSWGVADKNRIDIREEIKFPNSIGLLYTAFTVFAGYEANEGEYKLMGLAPYGRARYVDKIKKIIKTGPDGGFGLKMDYFSYHYDLRGVYTKKFESLFGSKNKSPDEIIPYYADIAASIQQVTEEIILKIVNHVHDKTNLDKICYAGGVAYNSRVNWLILKKSRFSEVFIQPAAGDSGGALGAALWAYHTVLGNKRKFLLQHAYWGDEETDVLQRKYLKKQNVKFRVFRSEESMIDEVTDKMEKGKVLGWVQGRFEWGPRALGNRSIIADPRSRAMKDIVNSKIKFREGFRPFAPSAIIETADKYFDIDGQKDKDPFKYMLFVVPVNKAKRSKLAAITHVDGTARPQFVEKKVNPLYHKLISSFGEKTGVNVILNTSFNLKGEPIVNTADEAMRTFMRSGLDALVLNNIIVERT